MGRPKKIRRRTRRVFRKGHSKIWRSLGMGALCIFVAFAGFITAKMIIEHTDGQSPVPDTSGSVSDQTEPDTGSAQTEPSDTPDTQAPSGNSEPLRAFYIPASKLSSTAALSGAVNGAAEAGFNAVLFDLKDGDGALYYRSAIEAAEKAAAETAVTTERLREAITELTQAGLTPVVRIFAFRDKTAPFNVAGGKIAVKGQPGYTWLDNSKDAGGRPWLNPYAQTAREYIMGIVSELAEIGIPAIMLDGVQFPEQTSQADFGENAQSADWAQTLTDFISEAVSAAGSGCRVIQTMPGLSAFKDQTKAYGANPVTFGAPVAAPKLMPDTLGGKLTAGETVVENAAAAPYEAVKLAASQTAQRIELIPGDNKPALMPWIGGASGYAEQIRALTEVLGSDAQYILYNSGGVYDFAALG